MAKFRVGFTMRKRLYTSNFITVEAESEDAACRKVLNYRTTTEEDATIVEGKSPDGEEGYSELVVVGPATKLVDTADTDLLDVLVEVLKESDEEFAPEWDYAPQAKAIRAALEARGLEIREKKQMTDDKFHKLALNESFERVAKVAKERDAFNEQMPKPDPLVEALTKAGWGMPEINAKELRAALGAVGFEIREKGQ